MNDIDLFLITAINFLLWKKVKLNRNKALSLKKKKNQNNQNNHRE